MKSIFSIESKFGRIVIQLGNLVQLSMFWLLFSLPIFTIGPACCALYTACRKLIHDEEGKVGHNFYMAFKENFKQGVIIGGLAIVLAVLCIFCILLLLAWNVLEGTVGTIAVILYLLVIVIVFSYFHYLIAYVTRFEDNLKTVFHNCVYLALVHLDTTMRICIQLFLVLLAVYYLNLAPYLPIILFCFPSVYCVLLVDPLEKVFMQYFPKEEEEEVAEDTASEE